MKSETLKEIQYLCQLIDLLPDDVKKPLNDSVMRIINYETEAPKVGKFDAFKFLGKVKKDDHPMCGVIHHQDGYADIFTRSYGVRCKSLYNEKYEGQCVNQGGEIAAVRYPNVRTALPEELKRYPISINTDAVNEAIKFYNNYRKLNKDTEREDCLIIVGGIAVFCVYTLQKLIEAAQLIKCNDFYLNMREKNGRQEISTIYCINDDGEFACAASMGISSEMKKVMFTAC